MMDRAAIHIHVQISVWICFQLLGEYQGTGLPDHIVKFPWNHQAIPKEIYRLHSHQQWIRVSVVPPPCYHLMMSEVLPILTGRQWFLVFCFFLFTFSWWGRMWSTYSYICHLCIFFGEVSIQIFCTFSTKVFLFLIMKVQESFVYFGLYQIGLLQRLCPNLWPINVFHKTKKINFNKIQIINYFFHRCEVLYPKTYHQTQNKFKYLFC